MAEENSADETQRIALAHLILELRRRGVRDKRIYSAIEQIPRRLFVPAPYRKDAFEDRPLPIECGQTISAPSVVAMMTDALAIEPEHRVLEIGTGSGYQTVVLSRLCKEVFSVERYHTLAALAEERLAVLRVTNVSVKVDDGANGWSEKAPFDRILLTASAPSAPRPLIDQLRIGGIMVMPMGPPLGVQKLMRIVRTQRGVDSTALADVRFVPMVPGVATKL
ncbi:protein-L-isoaspartate(D-aspartate) O-methyltransferase [Segnochrobactrum spirostomi]|uniref:Protein-L-isoaspartate O-methyltransferase n=1 Tax=Segnochrobactrum spirostomi TaxID=2608987 RepID=A0A6A7Y5H0_9HYPH|nr:protein-L-isoaspartate(D-aspartate) O-methyltransferase [Segnochrobactrum spirostomi]MQT14453.1 protein-L-isoaspartate(D-aspartate) O-methyltransferase [Segnochrobactrum spirostomi]